MLHIFMGRLLIIVICFAFFPTLTWAHHPGHGSSGARLTQYQGLKTKPASRAFFSYDLAVLDASIGEVHSFTVGGEWAFHKRFSALIGIPITTIRHDFAANQTGLGDIAVGGRFLIHDNEKTFSFASLAFEIPTGDENDGLGRGSLGTRIDLLGGLNLGEWSIFVSPGINFGWDSPHEPVINVTGGTSTPRFLEKIYFSLAFSNQIFAASDVFKNGSFKTYLEPQINWVVDKNEKLTLSVLTRVSIMDELERKSTVTLTSTSNSLLNDIKWSVGLGASYQF
ncbi:hypothetical protein K1X76_08515 [bacterium]|nr:hypothetical protein [bacterium]